MRAHDKRIPLALAALAYLLALVQRPGFATSDTKIDLHVDPAGFLGDVASVWTPTGSLGHVQGGQYSGYLFPMGPFFALGHALGLPEWLVGRLWLGTLLALGAWGIVRLLDAWLGPERGAGHVTAAVVYTLNPYVVVFSNQTSVTLLGYAALPWLLLCVHRGLRDARGWWWPAAVALLLAATGGGVNAAVTAWLLPALALLAVHDAARGWVAWRSVGSFALRAGALSLLASVWWIVPALVQAGYGIDFLRFTEQAGTIWATTSLSEALRLMSYWTSYIGVGFGSGPEPYYSTSGTLLFDLPVVLATLLVPAAALAGFVWSRRWRYGPFCLLLVLVGLVVMTVGFPAGTPLRRSATFTYEHFGAVQFLRTTYKAGPVVAIGLALLAGVGAAEAWRRLAGARRAVAAVAAAALVALSAWPLVTGGALERKLEWSEIPRAWRAAAADLDRNLPRGTRAAVLPGQLFAHYRWGGTVDPLLPALTDRPVAVRTIVPFADLRAAELQIALDTLVQQQRLVPGQLAPLLRLTGTGAVVTGSDDERTRSAAMPAAEAEPILREQLGPPARSFGRELVFRPSAQMLGAAVALPQVRRYDVTRSPGLVRLESGSELSVVDGSAGTVAAMSAFGLLRPGSPLVYAADRVPEAPSYVVGDSNRRRTFLSSQMQANLGYTRAADEPLPPEAALLDPFPSAGTDGQTVAVLTGARYVRAPLSPHFAQFPEHRPYAAFDGDPSTAWLADPNLQFDEHYLDVGFDRPVTASHVDVLPYGDSRARVTRMEVGGRSFRIHPGWNRLRVPLSKARTLRLEITDVTKPRTPPRGAGGIAEVRIRGVRVRERLRPPVVLARALRGRELRESSLTYLFERSTADVPMRVGSVVDEPQRRSRLDRRDPEPVLRRAFELPAARSFSADAWTSIDPRAPDPALDRLAGYRGGVRATSSSRFAGVPGHRASKALDGDPRSAWVGTWLAGRPAWLGWSAPRAVMLRSLRLIPPDLPVRVPTRVRIRHAGGITAPLAVGPGGAVPLPRAIRSRSLRIEVLATAPSPGMPRAEWGRRAVGVAEVVGAPRVRGRTAGPARFRCGDARMRVGGSAVALRPRADVAALDAGRPLRARQCGRPVALAAGAVLLDGVAATARVDHVRLASPAPAAAAGAAAGERAAAPAGRVLDPGTIERAAVTGVRLEDADGKWLVLGQSYNRGWRAYCGDRSLGAPEPIDGFANGWQVRGDCASASFRFAPQRGVWIGFAVSALACAAMLALLVVRRRRRTAGARPESAWLDLDPLADRPPRMPLARAAAVALPAAGLLAFLFALRAGVAIWPALTLILWRGVGARTLTLVAGALLGIVVPLLYVLFPAPDRGGYNAEYALKHIGAHWVAVAAFVALAVALVRTLSTASRRSRAPAGGRAGAGPSRSMP